MIIHMRFTNFQPSVAHFGGHPFHFQPVIIKESIKKLPIFKGFPRYSYIILGTDFVISDSLHSATSNSVIRMECHSHSLHQTVKSLYYSIYD